MSLLDLRRLPELALRPEEGWGMDSGLDGQVAIVTGGASGIGLATARTLAASGARVWIADIDESGSVDAQASLRREGFDCFIRSVDMGDPISIAALAEDVIEQEGGIDLVVNNAVRTDDRDRQVADIDASLWHGLLAANLIGPALLSRAVIPSMIDRGGGAFVHVASVGGLRGEDTRTCYGTAKAGLLGLSRSIAVQYGKQGIRSNCIAPGLVMTPAAQTAFDPAMLDMLRHHHMTAELGTADGIAKAITFLLSPAAAFLTGHVLVMDGGFSVATPIVPAFRSMGQDG